MQLDRVVMSAAVRLSDDKFPFGVADVRHLDAIMDHRAAADALPAVGTLMPSGPGRSGT